MRVDRSARLHRSTAIAHAVFVHEYVSTADEVAAKADVGIRAPHGGFRAIADIPTALAKCPPRLFAVQSRGFDLDQVERALKASSVYVCGAALLVCPL